MRPLRLPTPAGGFCFARNTLPCEPPSFPPDLIRDVASRRTFAIISHPDAGQDDADREAAAVRRRDPAGRHGQVAQERASCDVRLDGGREAARHLGDELGDAIPVRRAHGEPARHARPRGLLRGHVPRADRRRRSRHGHRRGEGCRSADDQAARRVPPARHADHHVRQQDGPRGARAAGAARPRSSRCCSSTARRSPGRSAWARRSAASTIC